MQSLLAFLTSAVVAGSVILVWILVFKSIGNPKYQKMEIKARAYNLICQPNRSVSWWDFKNYNIDVNNCTITLKK